MSIEAPETAGVGKLRELYLRYKGLAFATTARLLLEAPLADLLIDADALVADCQIAARGCEARLSVQLDACENAAVELRGLLGEASDAGVSSARISAARITHSRLRREVWKFIPCEYVPCSAGAPHAHEQ
jgi:hypothetical protein